jgi:dihydroorotate dehydrogenase
MYSILKPFLFRLSPEVAHQYTMRTLRFALRIPMMRFLFKKTFHIEDTTLERQVMGLTFANPVGLAAGFDKDGKYFADMAALGFGHIEIGTVTPRPQDGNPQPRLFRLPDSEALINRMGFNNEGADTLALRLKNYTKTAQSPIIGINIGKNKVTPNENAADDYLYCFETLFEYADYFVVNVSSPNTPDLRALQDKEPLLHLLQAIQQKNQLKPNPKPILLKIAPDLTDTQLDDILDIVETTQLSGIIATNTTIARQPLRENPDFIQQIGMGGLSGQPVKARSTAVIRYLRTHAQRKIVLIGVGGIQSGADAQEKIEAGADLVQVYTGLIYEGAGLVKRINQYLQLKFSNTANTKKRISNV